MLWVHFYIVIIWFHNLGMRLFTAIDPSPTVQSNLERLLEKLRPAAHIRWSRPEGLHLTLKFIGEWPGDRLPELQEALSSVAFEPFDLAASGLGFFPNARSPRVFWVGIQGPPALPRLAAEIEEALEPLGVAREKRAYSPHLTLARIENRTPLGRLHEAIRQLGTADCGTFRARSFYLYESRLAPGGSIYTKIHEFPGLGEKMPAGGL